MEPGVYDKNNKLIYDWKKLISSNTITKNNDEIIKMSLVFPEYNLVIDDNIKSINCDYRTMCSINKLYISSNLTDFKTEALRIISLQEYVVHPDNQYFYSENGVLFNKDKTILLKYPDKKIDEEYIVPDTVNKLASNAFFFNECLKSVKLPNIHTISDHAFYQCSCLQHVEMPKIKNIEEFSFYNTMINKIKFPKSLKKIGTRAFEDCAFLRCIEYNGNENDFKEISGYENIYLNNYVCAKDIQYMHKKSLEELLNNGKSMREINRLLKEYEMGR